MKSSERKRENTYVFVICNCGKPLMPTTAPKARILLKQSRARVFRLYPFTIQLNYETPHNTQPVDFRIDYGAKTHGIALVQQCRTHDRAIFLGEARQRQDVKKRIDIRRELRGARRHRRTRYREPRFNNRRRPKGWIPPTIAQRVQAITRIAGTLNKMASITSVSAEIGMFDTQRMLSPEIEGVEYQQGPGYEYENRRHAVLAYFNYTCQYCGTTKGVMTEEHVTPKGKGGSDAWSNLTCACWFCNKRKGERTPEEAGMLTPKTVDSINMKFLKFCALIQSGKTRLIEELQKLGSTQTAYGWQTKLNREAARLPKTHYYDALCTKPISEQLELSGMIYELKLRRRNNRQIHYSNPKKGSRRQYSVNRMLKGYRKGDLILTPNGLGYVTAILTSARLRYRTISGLTSTIVPEKAKLMESTRGTQFHIQKEENS